MCSANLLLSRLTHNLSNVILRVATTNFEPNHQQYRAIGNIIRPGLEQIMSPHVNKGMAFTMEERQVLCLNGLWPIGYRSMEMQLYAVRVNMQSRKENVSKYTYLMALNNRHEQLFYRFLQHHIEDVMPIIYTPTVGVACETYGLHYRSPMGLYVTIFDRGHVIEVLQNWRIRGIRAVCVTDGGRILGLGDLGAHGMGIVIGKLALYTALGSIPPDQLLPVTLDVGTDNEKLLCNPLYVGARIKRVKGKEYEDFVEEFMEGVVKVFGHGTFIHFEDFATPNAFKFLEKYKDCYSCFNDDIQGTGAAGLSGFLNVERVTKRKLEEHVFLFVGAGSAAGGIIKQLHQELVKRGMDPEVAAKNVYIYDVNGIVTKKSKTADIFKPYQKDIEPIKKLTDVVEKVKPSIILGATGSRGLFSEEVLRNMAKHNERPAIFALSNPTSNSECTAEQAYKFTEGRAIFCAGSPFPPVVINDKKITPSQANNCFVFPGIALGVMTARPSHVPDEIYSIAAESLAMFLSDKEIETGRIFPEIKRAPEIAFIIGHDVAKYLIESGNSHLEPKPDDLCKYMKENMYESNYKDALPRRWDYPDIPEVPPPEFDPVTKTEMY